MNTVESPRSDPGFDIRAWWEAAFSLEKLTPPDLALHRRGEWPVSLLIKNLPSGYETPDGTVQRFLTDLTSTSLARDMDMSNAIAVVAHKSSIDVGELFEEIRRVIEFSNDTVRRRCYYCVWLCGHLAIPQSRPQILAATLHPFASVRNIASESLGKMGGKMSEQEFREVVAALENRLDDDYYRARYHAAWSLGEIKSLESVERLDKAIAIEEVRYVRSEMERVREFLVQCSSQGHAGGMS